MCLCRRVGWMIGFRLIGLFHVYHLSSSIGYKDVPFQSFSIVFNR